MIGLAQSMPKVAQALLKRQHVLENTFSHRSEVNFTACTHTL